MNNPDISLNPNKLVQFLQKLPHEFTKADIIRFIEKNGIEMLNFRYVGADCKLKTLNFVINNKRDLDYILSTGERVDGSSLFPYIDPSSSDLYVIPKYYSAFINPFAEIPTIDLMCKFYTQKGEVYGSSPEEILKASHKKLKNETGFNFEAMGELEYYVISDKECLYPTPPQKGYHESRPFAKWEDLRTEAMKLIASIGGKIKYGHSEVGFISGEEKDMEQNEIEFLPTEVEDAADQLILAKWILRMLGYQYGVCITFAPKIMVGHAGSGFHIHTRLMKKGKNAMIEGTKLSSTAKKMISGFLELAPSVTAFGNTVPTSYLRLVPHQEAPTHICWGDRNRSVLVRVPLGWLGVKDMAKDANPQEKSKLAIPSFAQTVEFRAPDGSADIYLVMAALVTAARHGLKDKNSLKKADALYASWNIAKETKKKFDQLPGSCWESADMLKKQRDLYEKEGCFPPEVIDWFISRLKSYQDKDLSERLYKKNKEIEKLVEKYLHS
ncbi:MAG: glutamine synthetase family protein [bacterium]|nr:glutamine synthetase family protein [bacterium]